jgi:2-polyprenyl-3-methyl-5-hydroxy-6-metoxy-1,4-benzoquinol methylase
MPIDAMKDEATPFHSVYRCGDCGVGTTQPTPAADQTSAFYDLRNYYTQGESHIESASVGLFDRILTKLAWSLDKSQLLDPEEFHQFLPAGGTICDLGCGDGWNLERFKRRGFDVVGVDPDPKSRKKGQEKGVEILAGTSESLPPELTGRQFDFVVMTHSLEHTLNPLLALRNAAELTKPGGYFDGSAQESDRTVERGFLAFRGCCSLKGL